LHPHQHFDKGLVIDLSGANTLARGLPSTSVTSTVALLTHRQATRLQPRRFELHPRQHFGKGLAINLGNANTSARGSPSTSATSTAPSPHFAKGLTTDLGDFDHTLVYTSARACHPWWCQHFGKRLTTDLSDIDLTLTNTLLVPRPHIWVEDPHPPSAPSTSPSPHLSTSKSTLAPIGYL
jgi:hypothetical protein